VSSRVVSLIEGTLSRVSVKRQFAALKILRNQSTTSIGMAGQIDMEIPQIRIFCRYLSDYLRLTDPAMIMRRRGAPDAGTAALAVGDQFRLEEAEAIAAAGGADGS
jgi:hypothetical protein